MKSPLDRGDWVTLETVDSTQTVAAERLRAGDPVGVIFARNQTAGRGRFGRQWVSLPGESLTFSLVFRAYANHPKPHLVGMATALAVAGALHCEVRWPNDLGFGDKKLGGILTELLPDENGASVPVVGIGINLNIKTLPPEIAPFATSLALYRGGTYDPEKIAHQIVDRLALLPEPDSWSDLAPIWALFDNTPGKGYKLASGEEAIALGVGAEGQLICSVGGEATSVLAAEALFGA